MCLVHFGGVYSNLRMISHLFTVTSLYIVTSLYTVYRYISSIKAKGHCTVYYVSIYRRLKLFKGLYVRLQI